MSQRVRQIVSVLRKRGEPQYRLKQVLDGIYGDRVDRRPASHWYEIESIPQSLQFALSEELGRNVSTLRPIQQIEDKEATKQLFAVAEEGDKERGNRGRNHGKTPGVRAGDDGPRDDGRMVGGTAGGDVDSAGRGPAPTGGPTSSTHENLGRSEDFPGGVPVSDTGTPPGKSSDLPKIEAVSLKFHSHRSLCISSQIGCAFKCAFCATGSIGFKQQLSADQIVDQILFFQRHHRRDFDRKWEERRRKELLEQETTISLVGGGGAGAAGGPPGTGVDAGAPTRSSSGSGILRLTNNLRLSSGGETELPDDELSASFEASAAVALKVRTKDLPKPDSIDSVSIMGMGEALANPKIFDALEVMTDPLLLGFSQRRINVSTVGVIPGIAKLLDKFPQCNLAFSLHSPFPEERDRLVPLNRMYPFQEVFKYLDERIEKTGRRIWIAYLLLPGTNDSLDHAKALVQLLKERPVAARHLYHVNLLPYNDTSVGEGQGWRGRSPAVEAFRKELEEARISCSYRNSFGTEIDAACGQLFASYERNKVIGQEKRNVKRNYAM